MSRCNCDKYNPNCRCYEETTMRDTHTTTILDTTVPNVLIDRYVDSIMTTVKERDTEMDDTTARDAGEELVDEVGDEIWVDLRPHLVESDPLHSAIEDTARHVIRIVRAHDAAAPAPEGTIYIGSAEIRPFKDPGRAHDAAPPDDDAVERVADIFRAARAGRYVSHQDAARAALAVMPAPGDTLEGLLGDEWDIGQARRAESGGWIVTVWRLPYSPRQLIRDGAYGAGPTIADAARAALAAAEGQGDV